MVLKQCVIGSYRSRPWWRLGLVAMAVQSPKQSLLFEYFMTPNMFLLYHSLRHAVTWRDVSITFREDICSEMDFQIPSSFRFLNWSPLCCRLYSFLSFSLHPLFLFFCVSFISSFPYLRSYFPSFLPFFINLIAVLFCPFSASLSPFNSTVCMKYRLPDRLARIYFPLVFSLSF